MVEKEIMTELMLSWEASEKWAKNQAKLYESAELSFKEIKIIECSEHYRDSEYGSEYVDGGCPKLSDKELAVSMTGYYLLRFGRQIERLEKEGDKEDEIDQLFCEIGKDADIFLRNYLLGYFISLILIPKTILDSFDNYIQAKSFVKRVNPNKTAKEVVQLYREISGRESPNDNGGWTIAAFAREMNKMGICYLSARALQTEFAK